MFRLQELRDELILSQPFRVFSIKFIKFTSFMKKMHKKFNFDAIIPDVLLDYILPIKKSKKPRKKHSGLEDILDRTPKLGLKFLEKLLNPLSKDNGIKILGKINGSDISEFIKNNDVKIKNEHLSSYSIIAERKKDAKENFGYRIIYEETETVRKLSIKFEEYASINNNYLKNRISDRKLKEKNFSFEIKKEKSSENPTKDNYSIKLVYENNYEEERLSVNYKSTIGTYLNKRQEAIQDFSDRVPGKQLDTFPVSGNEGLYGFTFLGDNKAWRRDDLTGSFAKMVDIHESIHTPDEYETRVLTDWIMSKDLVRYKK
jgi:hypothetical protein